MNISGPAAVAKPEMLFYAPGDLTVTLDVTLNPLVALYFATETAVTYKEGKNKQYQRCEQDGKIFYGFAPWHSVTELGVRVAMKIPFVEFSDMSTLPNF